MTIYEFLIAIMVMMVLFRIMHVWRLVIDKCKYYDDKIKSLQKQIDGYSKALENIIGVTEAHNEALKRIDSHSKKSDIYDYDNIPSVIDMMDDEEE